jgi:hypothetical protein
MTKNKSFMTFPRGRRREKEQRRQEEGGQAGDVKESAEGGSSKAS